MKNVINLPEKSKLSERQKNHELLMLQTAALPCKKIPINGEDYLERYFVGEDPDGTQKQLHRFLKADEARHFHNHPWIATSEIICGGYQEESVNFNTLMDFGVIHTKLRSYFEGHKNYINPETYHRICNIHPNTWTYLEINPGRLKEWFFIDEETGAIIETVPTSPTDWWKSCKTRDGHDYDPAALIDFSWRK